MSFSVEREALNLGVNIIICDEDGALTREGAYCYFQLKGGGLTNNLGGDIIIFNENRVLNREGAYFHFQVKRGS